MAPELLQIADEVEALQDELKAAGKPWKRRNDAFLAELKRRCGRFGYGKPVDAWSAGVVFGQLLFGIVEEDITDDDDLDAKGQGMAKRARLLPPKERTEAHSLFLRMVDENPDTRISIQDALSHPYFAANNPLFSPLTPRTLPLQEGARIIVSKPRR